MKATLEELPLTDIKRRPQPRQVFRVESMEGLKANMAACGLQQPIVCVREGEDRFLVDGDRRFQCAQSLGWRTIMVLVAEDEPSALEILKRQLSLNLQRESLTLLERASAFHQLIEEGKLTADRVAKELGLSPASVSRNLAVLGLPDRIKALIADGRISADSAYLLTRIDDPNEQAAMATEIAEGRLTRDALQRKLRRTRRSRSGRQRGAARVIAPLGAGRYVSVTAADLTLDSFIELLEQLLTRARRSKGQGRSLSTFLGTLRDQASSTENVA